MCGPSALLSILLSSINGRWPGALAAYWMSRGQDVYKYLVRYRGRRSVYVFVRVLANIITLSYTTIQTDAISLCSDWSNHTFVEPLTNNVVR